MVERNGLYLRGNFVYLFLCYLKYISVWKDEYVKYDSVNMCWYCLFRIGGEIVSKNYGWNLNFVNYVNV